jgi:hypothetical protein
MFVFENQNKGFISNFKDALFSTREWKYSKLPTSSLSTPNKITLYQYAGHQTVKLEC